MRSNSAVNLTAGRLLSGLIAALAAVLLWLAADSSTFAAQAAEDVLDPTYDDSWVGNVSGRVGDFNVLYITTPKDRACSTSPVITLQTQHENLKGYLEAASQMDLQGVLANLRSVADVPDDTSIKIVGPNASVEAARQSLQAWNAARLESGCDTRWTDIADEPSVNERGYAIFQNVDAGDYSDDNAQRFLSDHHRGLALGKSTGVLR